MSIEKILTELTASIDRLTAAVAGGYNPAAAAPAPAKGKAKAAKPEPEAEAPAKAPAKAEAPAKAAPAATQEECTAAAQALLQASKRDALVALLADVGAPNVRSIPPEKFGEFVQAAKAALEA